MSTKEWRLDEVESLIELKSRELSDSDISAILNRSRDSIRKKWKRVKENPPVAFDNSVVVDFKTEEETVNPHEYLASKIKSLKSDLVRKDDLKTFSDLLKSKASYEILGDKLVTAVESLPPVSPRKLTVPKPTTSSSEEVAVLVISDWHVGLLVDPDENYNLGNFNIDIFRQRCKEMTQRVIDIITLHRKMYPVTKLVIFCLGDLVQGMNRVGKWTPVHMEQDILTQVFSCLEELEIMIAKFVQFFANVEFHGVVGNHGRMAEKGFEKDYVNWDYLAYIYLQKGLQHQDNLLFNIGKSLIQIAQVQNTKFLLTHGDEFRGDAGLLRGEMRYRGLISQFKNQDEGLRLLAPFIERVEKSPNNMALQTELVSAALQYAKAFDHMVVGHMHIAGVMPTTAGNKIIRNGTLIGGDNYSIRNIQSASVPTQKLFGVNHKRITWQYDLELD